MYRIMIVASKKDGARSLYQYLTQTVDGEVSPMEFSTKESLDAYVERMLNGNYSKSDFIIVKPVDYTLSADDYTDEEPVANEPTNEPATEEPSTEESPA